jgi:hypothetical protein
MLIVFLYHSASFFDTGDWPIKNPDTSMGFTIFMYTIAPWFMPFMFLLSGAGSWFALEYRDSKEYIWERAKRLLVPYFSIGFFILIPPQDYWEHTTHSRFTGSFLQFIPHYLKTNNWMSFGDFHLWFLYYLFILSFICLPLMIYLKSEQGRKVIDKIANLCSHREAIYLFVVPLALGQVILKPLFPHINSWADIILYIMCFVIGYIIQGDERFTRAIRKDGWIGIIPGISIFIITVYFLYKPENIGTYIKHPTFSISCMIFWAMAYLYAWCMMVFLLSIGTLFLNFTNKTLSYCNEAVLPFYVLHQTLIMFDGYLIINWQTNLPLKFAVLIVMSFAMVMLIYELIIRRNRTMRFLFGLKAKKV